jgi:signal transduction histidine kinase
MRVDTPTLLAVFAHELRGPLSALQGYLRLLEQRHAPEPAETTMIQAMRKSTDRLAALGREASDLAGWMARAGAAAPSPEDGGTTTVGALVAGLTKAPAGAVLAAPLSEPVANAACRTTDAALLIRACRAVAAAVARNHDNQPAQLDVREEERVIHLRLLVSPASGHGTSTEPTATALRFDQGGMGLELILAAHVLDGHGARLTPAASGGVDIQLPREPRS